MIVARGYITLTNIQGSANLIDWQSQWKEGELPAGWRINGVAAENSIAQNTNPFGVKSLMWKCTPDTAEASSGGPAGGFVTPYYFLDNTHTYRYVVFVYREKASKGYIYHGCHSCDNLEGTANTNPYFYAAAIPAGQWFLLIGYIHPSKADAKWQMSTSGIYDMAGKKIASGTDFKLRNPNVNIVLRNYLYTTNNPEDVAYFYNPRLEVCDGNEQSIEQLLQVSTREEIDSVKVDYKSEIQKLDNKIAFSVSEVKSYTDNTAKAEASKAVDEIKIGGRNLIRYFYDNGESCFLGYQTIVTIDGEVIRGVSNADKPGWPRIFNYSVRAVKLNLGKPYTISFEARANEACSRTFAIGDSNGRNLVFSSWCALTTEWTLVTFTFTPSVQITGNNTFFIYTGKTSPNTDTSSWTEIKKLKLESGNKATDWSLAPEDVAADAQIKADAARVAAEAVAVAKANLAKTESQAYADGKVTAEEQRAIADAQAKLNEAKVDAQAKANAAQSAAATDATTKANNATNNAITALTKDFKYPVGRYYAPSTKGLFLFTTKIPEKRTNMVCANFEGYMYGGSSPYGVKLVFYTYTTGLSSFGYIVTGADFVDRIRLGIKDGMVCIEMKFKQDVYYPGFIVDIAATMGNFPRSYAEGWTFLSDNIATGYLIDDTYTNVVVVPRRESFAETQSKAQFQILSDQIASKVSTDSFNALGLRVSSAESTITQQAAQIALKASQSDLTALGNRVSSAEAKITPDAIKLTVRSQTEQIVADNSKRTEVTVDGTSLDPNKYYPITIKLLTNVLQTITVERPLSPAYGVPAYSTHASGFSMMSKWSSNGGGWGSSQINRTVHSSTFRFVDSSPSGTIGQLEYSSQEYIYVRGGSKYNVLVEGAVKLEVNLRTSDYTWTSGNYSQTLKVLDSITVPEITYKTISDIQAGISIVAGGISIFGLELSLAGKVTFASLASDAQSKVNNAQSTANSAVSKADAAQSTANTAVFKADTAQSGLTVLIDKLGDLSYEDMVGIAKLDSTIIEGGYLKTGLIDVNAIITNSLLAEKIAATDITTGRLTVTDGATIAGWKIVGNAFKITSAAAAKILVEPSGTRFLRINDSIEELMAIRADGVTGINIYTSDASGKCLRLTAQTGGTAIESYGGCTFTARNGENIDMKGEMRIQGLSLHVQGVTSSYTRILNTTTYVVCNNTTDINPLLLPENVEQGHLILIYQNKNKVTLSTGGGTNIVRYGTVRFWFDLRGRGCLHFLLWDGSNWIMYDA